MALFKKKKQAFNLVGWVVAVVSAQETYSIRRHLVNVANDSQISAWVQNGKVYPEYRTTLVPSMFADAMQLLEEAEEQLEADIQDEQYEPVKFEPFEAIEHIQSFKALQEYGEAEDRVETDWNLVTLARYQAMLERQERENEQDSSGPFTLAG